MPAHCDFGSNFLLVGKTLKTADQNKNNNSKGPDHRTEFF